MPNIVFVNMNAKYYISILHLWNIFVDVKNCKRWQNDRQTKATVYIDFWDLMIHLPIYIYLLIVSLHVFIFCWQIDESHDVSEAVEVLDQQTSNNQLGAGDLKVMAKNIFPKLNKVLKSQLNSSKTADGRKRTVKRFTKVLWPTVILLIVISYKNLLVIDSKWTRNFSVKTLSIHINFKLA